MHGRGQTPSSPSPARVNEARGSRHERAGRDHVWGQLSAVQRRLQRMRHLLPPSLLLFVVAFAAAGCGIAGTGGSVAPSVMPEGASASVPTDPSTSDLAATRGFKDSVVLGPEGVGRLRLGMSPRQISRIGGASAVRGSLEDGFAPGCRVLLIERRKAGRASRVAGLVSPRGGLEQIRATRQMVTPEGLRVGASLAEASQALDRPDLAAGDYLRIRASVDSVYVVQVGLGSKVTAISLERPRVACSR